MADNESLELEVKDFGPIGEAKVDLRPLTVFMGPSNTGKSYLAILIYALHRFFSGFPRYAGGAPFFYAVDPDDLKLSEEAIGALVDSVRSIADMPEYQNRYGITLPSAVAKVLRDLFDASLKNDSIFLEIGRCFGLPGLGDLVRKGGEDEPETAHVVMRRRIGEADFVNHTLSFGDENRVRTDVPADRPVPVELDAKNTRWGRDTRYHLRYLTRIGPTGREQDREIFNERLASEWLTIFGETFTPVMFGPLHRPAGYLPADRTGVMHAHSALVSAFIGSALTAGLRPIRMPLLTGVLADFLRELIGIAGYAHKRAKTDFGKALEDDILAGTVSLDRPSGIDYPHFTYRPHEWTEDMALANASSMVSELAPLVLYLRYVVEPGNVLIVEEPESHLHPAMQVKLINQLAMLVDRGFRILVTTHSEWLMEGLANIVRRSELPGDGRGGKKATLRPDQVGVFMFEPRDRSKGSRVREIKLDDSGLYETGYDEVAFALHNDWADWADRADASSHNAPDT
ncbi:MAG: AAA family ATPase [Hyphomonadaceae bacterium]|nr:AAA family ATPase [Hyphomonadaceae bacterium]